MATHADIAANLLRNAAVFFRDVGEQNPSLKDQMAVNAETFETVAQLLETDPTGEMEIPEGEEGDAEGEG
ncbi:MAG: hypothetical protein ISR52_00110 [Rhodospirillales bacterium]|nr:hypothetical protein [Rhodospirillales bacterium]